TVPEVEVSDGRRWFREDSDLIAFRHYRRTDGLTLSGWLRSYRGVRESSTFSLSDPLPFLTSMRLLAADTLGGRRSRRAAGAVALARLGVRVDAIDPVEAMVSMVRDQAAREGVGDRVHAVRGDVHALEAEAGAYDLVLALGVIAWLHSPAQGMAEMARVLRPG